MQDLTTKKFEESEEKTKDFVRIEIVDISELMLADIKILLHTVYAVLDGHAPPSVMFD